MKKEIDLLQFPAVKRVLGKRKEKHREIARRFDREFFDGERDTGYGGYAYDGRWRPVALRMLLHYALAEGASRVLDVGCGKGFLVKDFRAIGIRAYGIDISAYAISQSVEPLYTMVGDARHLPALLHQAAQVDLAVSINTLHNLERDELARALQAMMTLSRHQYVTLDAWRNDEERERMLAWNLTAKTLMHVDEWQEFFLQVGYTGDYSWFIP